MSIRQSLYGTRLVLQAEPVRYIVSPDRGDSLIPLVIADTATDVFAQRRSEPDRNAAFFIVAITAFAAIIRLDGLGAARLWTDEGWSYAIATMPRYAMWHIVLTRETNRGIYYLFLHLWVLLFGSSETSLRLPSALASIATVPLLYACGRRMFSAAAGLIAAMLLCVSPVSIWFARDATAYSLEIMFAAASLLFLLRALERPATGNVAGWVACSWLAVSAHAVAVAAVPAQLLPLTMLDRRNVPWRRLLPAAIIFLVAAVPLLWLVRHNDHGQVNWIPRLSWFAIGMAFFGVANSMMSDFSGHLVIAAYGIGIIFGFAATIRAYDRSPSTSVPFLLAASGVLLPFAFLSALSLLKPLLVFRYLIFCLPYFWLYVAGGIAAVRTRVVVIACTAMLLATSTWHAWDTLEHSPRYDWRDAAEYIMRHAHRGDALAVTYGPNRILLEYYLNEIGMPPRYLNAVFPDWSADLFIQGRYFVDADAQQFLAMRLLETIDVTAASKRRLWFVEGAEPMHSFDQWASLPVIEQRMSVDYRSVDTQTVGYFTIILCSGPRAAGPAH